MAYVLELHTSSTQHYIQNFIVAKSREFNIRLKIIKQTEKVLCVFDSEHPRLQKCLDSITQILPASFFLHSASNYILEEQPESFEEIHNEYPLNLGLCPSCQKELFDVSSRRYYYPFISCSCCGGNYSFLQHYPYTRENTSLKYLQMCQECEDEVQDMGLRENHKTNSCHKCGVAVRLVDKKNERYANDAGSFRTMFEVAAKAIADGKKLLVKTTFGYRVFYTPSKRNNNSILMMINASKITDNLSLITEEFNTLLSIERPILDVTLKNEELKDIFGANTSYVKYPDEGFSILLSAELQKLGFEYILYEDVDEDYDADMVMEYDLEIYPQKDLRVFLNKETLFMVSGERVSFPSSLKSTQNILSVAGKYVGIPKTNEHFFDTMEHFEGVEVHGAHILEDDTTTYHSNQKHFSADEGSFLSVIAEHHLFGVKCVGVYFEEEASFLYYDGKSVIKIVPAKEFKSTNLLEKISTLREGSDKLLENLKQKMPHIYTQLQNIQQNQDAKLFNSIALILELEDISPRGVVKEAMKFIGKGGIQIDTHIKDNRFDYVAFLASIISYKLAGVSATIIAYSIYESLGDYFSELLVELQSKTKSQKVILCGEGFASQSLFSRMQRNLKQSPPLMNKNYPISKESAVVGGVFI